MTKRIPKDDEEEKLKFGVIGRALHLNSSYDFLGAKDYLYHNFPFPNSWKKKNYLVKLFYAADNLQDFLDCFPTPKQTDFNIKQSKDFELKELVNAVRKKREKLEYLVIKKAVTYCSNSEYPKEDENRVLSKIECQLFDAVQRYSAYQQYKDNFNAHLKEVEWIRNI
jgi:hypothetical protein